MVQLCRFSNLITETLSEKCQLLSFTRILIILLIFNTIAAYTQARTAVSRTANVDIMMRMTRGWNFHRSVTRLSMVPKGVLGKRSSIYRLTILTCSHTFHKHVKNKHCFRWSSTAIDCIAHLSCGICQIYAYWYFVSRTWDVLYRKHDSPRYQSFPAEVRALIVTQRSFI